jgi:hypothetical protein
MTPLRPRIVAAASIPPGGRTEGVRHRLRGNRSQLVAVIALSFSILGWWLLAAPADATADRSAAARGALEQAILVEVNVVRREHGLVPLRRSPALAAAARQHSAEMVSRGYFDHSSADGSSFARRIARFYPAGRRYWAVGENLLWSTEEVDAARALDMWLRSPAHRRNILTPRWREFGLGAAHVVSAPGVFGGRAVTIVTTDFGVRR